MPTRTLTAALAATTLLALPASALARSPDRNHDGLPDTWETRHHLSLKVNQAARDTDRDGLNNRGELRRKTDPQRADTDSDGLKDGAEVRTGNDPRKRDTDGDGVRDGKENAGKVSSFSGNMLTITLPDGSKLSGKVTDATRVSCSNRSSHDEREVESDTETVHHRRGGSATAEAARNDPQPVGGSGSGSGSPSTDPAPATDPASATETQHGGNGNETESETEHGDENETEHADGHETENAGDSGRNRGPGRSASCATTQLTAGTVVHGARMGITSDGAVFEAVELLK